jgi:hypothetical protein
MDLASAHICCAFSNNLGGGGPRPSGRRARHLGAEPGVGGRVEQFLNALCIKMRGHPRVVPQQRAKRAPFDERRLGGLIDDVMGVLPADRGAEVEHDGFGHD